MRLKKKDRRIMSNKRIKDRLLNYYVMGLEYLDTQEEVNERIGKLFRCRTSCSCWMCGNPRKYKNGNPLTLQEQKAPKIDEWDEPHTNGR